MTHNYDAMATTLEATGDYRVLRRLQYRRHLREHDGSPTRIGILLDLETTGLNPASDEIIEMAMVPFVYSTASGHIFEVMEPFQRFRQPSSTIPPEITQLTGITDEMVAGQSIDPAEVAAFIAPAAIVIAHNASFDRKFAENFCESFSTKAWGCSLNEIDWKAEGFDGGKLGYLLAGCGLFHNGHRAVDDCFATVEVLSRPLPVTGVPALAKLLEAARTPTCRIWAEGSPFDAKDRLKARGYKWSDGSNGRPKSWFRDVSEGQLAAELEYLRSEIYQRDVDPTVVKLTAYDRFSVRC